MDGFFLLDGNRRRQHLNQINGRFVEGPQKLAGLVRKRLHIAPLPFGIEGVESECGLARSGKAGDNHQLVFGQGHVNIAEIVLAGTMDGDFICSHCRAYSSIKRDPLVLNAGQSKTETCVLTMIINNYFTHLKEICKCALNRRSRFGLAKNRACKGGYGLI